MDTLLTVLLHGGAGGHFVEELGDILLFIVVLVIFGGFGAFFLLDRWLTRRKERQ